VLKDENVHMFVIIIHTI